VIVDQHFLRRQRMNRLVSAVLDRPDLLGVGIDERTAVVFHAGALEVVGESQVVVLDARRAAVHPTAAGARQAAWDLRFYVLRDGMSFDLAEGAAR